MSSLFLTLPLLVALAGEQAPTPAAGESPAKLDAQVKAFLDQARGQWHDWNVSYEDGAILHGLIVEGGFRSILEIGTSTGHSTIWLAWAAARGLPGYRTRIERGSGEGILVGCKTGR